MSKKLNLSSLILTLLLCLGQEVKTAQAQLFERPENATSPASTANTPPPPPTTNTLPDPVLQRRQERLEVLRKELELLQLQRDIINQQSQGVTVDRQIFDNLLPNVTDASKPLEGKFEGINNLQGESRFLILDGVQKIANTIKNRVPKRSTVVVFDDELLTFLNDYRRLNLELDLLIAKYTDILVKTRPQFSIEQANEAGIPFPPSQVLRSFELLTGVTRSVIDFVALFRTKRTFSEVEGEAFLREDVLASTIAGTLAGDKTRQIQAYYPSIYAPYLPTLNSATRSLPTINQSATFTQTDSVEDTLSNFIFRRQQLQNLQQLLGTEIPPDLKTQTEELLKNWPIEKVIKGVVAYELLERENAYLLYVKRIYAVGNNQVTQSLFGSTPRHSGNVIMSYILFDQQGAIADSDLLYYHSGFEEFPAPRHNFQPIAPAISVPTPSPTSTPNDILSE